MSAHSTSTSTSARATLEGTTIDPELAAKMREARQALGPEYRPRTRHFDKAGAPRYTNRLIFETSPYLLQHAHNPVSWYPWGPEAFRDAQTLGRAIFLSIGYSTCHWCHVMEHESFEDEEIAAYINAHFIPIKVDREERPDIDSVYMNAVLAMNQGSGGWPMTVVMTPDGKPFFGGTYFPPRDGARGARIGLLTILKRIAEAYAENRAAVEESAGRLSALLRENANRLEPQGIPRADALASAARLLAAQFDPQFGGFGAAPKFPRPSTYDFLLRYWRRTQDPNALYIVVHSLANMIDGGVYDQIGGGFHRYSTDERWLVPHFEKMLYDNAQLVVTLLEAYQASREPKFAATARDTLEYVLREMSSPEGGFYSATDADSEGEEGLFFVWTPEQIEAVLGAELARVAAEYWGVTRYGNFEGKNILHRPKPAQVIAAKLGISEGVLEEKIAEARRLLYAAREKRVHPLLDDKVLTEWNAQMISAFAAGARVLEEPRYLERAVKAGEFILAHLMKEGRLLRAWRKGQAKHAGVLEDYAFLIAAFLDLYEGTGDPKWIREAISLQKVVDAHFGDSRAGAYFSTPDDGEALLTRSKESYDGAQPAGNSIAVANLLRLAELTGEQQYRRTAERAFQALGAALERAGLQCPKLAAALDWYLDRPKQVVIVAAANDDGAALKQVLARTFLPNRVLIFARDGAEELVPLLENKRALDGKATAYVCTEGVCKKPATSPELFAKQLAEAEMLPMQKRLTLPE